MEHFSATVWSQRVKELESSTKRDSDDLAELATLLARADKHLNWAHRQHRAQQRKALATERGLALARCCLLEARIRERLAHWTRTHTAEGGAAAELEADVVDLLDQLLQLALQHLQPRDPPADPLADQLATRRRGAPDESLDEPESPQDS